ncbi:hypothetical protein [Streptomyces sp. NPDC001658]
MSELALAARLDLPSGAFKNLMRGANGRPPGRTVRRETAEAVLGYWPCLEDFPDTALIDATGTRRRAQALAVLGWSGGRLAPQVGMFKDNFNTCLRGERVSARFARKVAGLYDLLWTQRPEDHGVPPGVASRVRSRAASAGFYGPLAWDDDTIDDPKAVPMTDASAPAATEGGNLADRWLLGESVVLDAAARKQVIRHFFEWTELTVEQIAARLEMTPAAVDQAWNRVKKQARLEGSPVPWRRTYALRDKDLDQKDVQEAA